MSEETKKKEMLEHYATGELEPYVQVDGWINYPKGYSFMFSDEDNDALTMGTTLELRHHGSAIAVRVQIHADTEKKDALRILNKLSTFVEGSYDDMRDSARLFVKQFDEPDVEEE